MSSNSPRKINACGNDLKRANITRADVGLLPITVKPRRCLKCDSTFDSLGPENRICLPCKEWPFSEEDRTAQ